VTVKSERVPPEQHHDHRDVTGGWLRPGVFGMMDGLVSNTAIISGVAGGGVSGRALVLTGVAGLAAGAFSMATGEYISVASQSELTRAEIEIEKAEIARVPEAEEAELAAIYRSRGVDEATAREVARQLSADPEQVWRVHAREELGVDPDDLPSPWVASGSSFVAFSIGALVPLLPYLLGARSLALAVVLAGVALFLGGALVSRFTNRTALYSGARQLLMGGLAAAVTYLVGQAVGTGVS
jgi:VIT1/CCC1 family predicted Fe2+/Mn2+ transporter